jgi:hypothetical protein
MTIFERLDVFFRHKSLSFNKVSDLVGISPGLLSKGLKKKDSSLGSEKIIKILEYFPELSAEWLLRGTEPMIMGESKTGSIMTTGECQLCKEKDNTIVAMKDHIEHMDEEIKYLRNKQE